VRTARNFRPEADIQAFTCFTSQPSKSFFVGQPTVVEGPAPEAPFLAIFDDDEITGYFYALDASKEGQPILDALQTDA
jgi:hypothetical protein